MLLKKNGYSVSIFESNSYPGGKLSDFRLNKFRFDAGPPLFTLPNLVDDLFILCGENPSDFFKYKKKEIPLHEFDMFFIQLSYPRRREYFCDIEKRWRRYHPDKEKWAEDYLKYKYSEVQGRVIEQIAVKSIRAYCKELGKPLFLCTQWKNANKDLDYDPVSYTHLTLPTKA